MFRDLETESRDVLAFDAGKGEMRRVFAVFGRMSKALQRGVDRTGQAHQFGRGPHTSEECMGPVRIGEVSVTRNVDRDGRGASNRSQSFVQRLPSLFRPRSDKLGCNVQIRHGIPMQVSRGAQFLEHLLHGFEYRLGQGNASEQSHRCDPIVTQGPEYQQGAILPRRFYARDAITVARNLLGKHLCHGPAAGRIVEVEAYLDLYHGERDLAAHSAAGITTRTKVIFGEPGHAYVYLSYGMHECLNVVAEPAGKAGCVLIRALEPLAGVAAKMNGPGKLTKAMGVSRACYGHDFTQGELTIRDGSSDAFEIDESPRIGITKCVDWPLRFTIRGSRFLSR